METKSKKLKLPQFFKPLFWSYKFYLIDPQRDRERVIINTINYGDWQHWQWTIKYYGRNKLREIIINIPDSEFRGGSLRLISLLLNIKKMRYASRGVKIKAEKNNGS